MHSEIYLFRHGQTTFNRDKRFTGWKDAKLTVLGKRQAEKISQKLLHQRIDVAICTSLSRSKETLQIVLKHHPECQVVLIDDRIRERRYGKLEGKTHQMIIDQFGQKKFDEWHRSYKIAPPGGENIFQVEQRVKPFMKEWLNVLSKAPLHVAICAHGNSMRPMRKQLEKLSTAQMMKLENPWDDYFCYPIRVKDSRTNRPKK